jgi:chaperonin GroES
LALTINECQEGECMNLQPLGDRVVVQSIEAEQVTASGIVLPDTAAEKPQRGRVLAVGAGRFEDCQRVPPQVAEGDEVIYSKYGGTEVKVDGQDLLILRESDILAKAV